MPAHVKICLFNSCPVWGGGEKWHHEVATSLDRNRFEIIAGVQQNSPLQQRLEDAGISTKEFSIGNMSLLNPWCILSLVRWFKQERPDIVILNLPSDLKAAGVAAKIAGVPRIIYRRGSAIPVRNTFLNRWLFSSILTGMIANSQETKKTVLSRNPDMIDADKIRVIYNGIDLQSYSKEDSFDRGKEQEGPVVLGTVGRLSYQKNHTFLLDVAAELKRRGFDFRLLLAGDGPLAPQLKDKAAELELMEQVDFLGFVHDIESFMEKIDIFLLCSHWEGFGYVLTEAMASSKPVIAFNSSSTPEVVVDGETGLLTEPGQVKTFCDAIITLSDDPGMRQAMGKAGRRRVEKFFTKEKQLEELSKFLLA